MLCAGSPPGPAVAATIAGALFGRHVKKFHRLIAVIDALGLGGVKARDAATGLALALAYRIPVRVITHPQPGLFGAAAAFAEGG